MDNIVLTDVSLFIKITRDEVIKELSNDAYYLEYINKNQSMVLFDFYKWAFRYFLQRFFFITVEDFSNNASFQNAFNKIEPKFGYFFRQQLTKHEISLVSQTDRVSVVFSGRLLFILPSHVHI